MFGRRSQRAAFLGALSFLVGACGFLSDNDRPTLVEYVSSQNAAGCKGFTADSIMCMRDLLIDVFDEVDTLDTDQLNSSELALLLDFAVGKQIDLSFDPAEVRTVLKFKSFAVGGSGATLSRSDVFALGALAELLRQITDWEGVLDGLAHVFDDGTFDGELRSAAYRAISDREKAVLSAIVKARSTDDSLTPTDIGHLVRFVRKVTAVSELEGVLPEQMTRLLSESFSLEVISEQIFSLALRLMGRNPSAGIAMQDVRSIVDLHLAWMERESDFVNAEELVLGAKDSFESLDSRVREFDLLFSKVDVLWGDYASAPGLVGSNLGFLNLSGQVSESWDLTARLPRILVNFSRAEGSSQSDLIDGSLVRKIMRLGLASTSVLSNMRVDVFGEDMSWAEHPLFFSGFASFMRDSPTVNGIPGKADFGGLSYVSAYTDEYALLKAGNIFTELSKHSVNGAISFGGDKSQDKFKQLLRDFDIFVKRLIVGYRPSSVDGTEEGQAKVFDEIIDNESTYKPIVTIADNLLPGSNSDGGINGVELASVWTAMDEVRWTGGAIDRNIPAEAPFSFPSELLPLLEEIHPEIQDECVQKWNFATMLMTTLAHDIFGFEPYNLRTTEVELALRGLSRVCKFEFGDSESPYTNPWVEVQRSKQYARFDPWFDMIREAPAALFSRTKDLALISVISRSLRDRLTVAVMERNGDLRKLQRGRPPRDWSDAEPDEIEKLRHLEWERSITFDPHIHYTDVQESFAKTFKARSLRFLPRLLQIGLLVAPDLSQGEVIARLWWSAPKLLASGGDGMSSYLELIKQPTNPDDSISRYQAYVNSWALAVVLSKLAATQVP